MRAGIVLVIFGVLIIASRGPLVIAPARTVQVYRRLLTASPMVLAMVGSVWGATGPAVPLVTFVGWVAVASSLFPLLAPSAWRSLPTGFLSVVEGSRVAGSVGVFAVTVGAGVVYYGASLLQRGPS